MDHDAQILPEPKGPPAAPLGARGALPVLFRDVQVSRERLAGILEIPGVAFHHASRTLQTTWDAAWAVARLLDRPEPEVPSHVGELPGLARYQALKLHERTRPYQKEDILFLARRAYAILAEPMRCLSGDAELSINRGGATRRLALRDLVYRFEGGLIRRGKGALTTWSSSIDTFTQSIDAEGFVRLNRIRAVHRAGMKAAFMVRTADGRQLVASSDHAFGTPDGFRPLSDLRVGDLVYVTVRPKAQDRDPPKNPERFLGGLRAHPFARQYTCQRRGRVERSARVLKHRLIAESSINGLDLETYLARVRSGDIENLVFLDPKIWHVHHRNGDPTDHRPENLEVLSQDEYAALRNTADKWKNAAARRQAVRIEQITEVEPEEMFDLTMEDPLNNYVANGFVVHNSGKCLMSLGAATLIDARKVLIVCPEYARLGWADEVQEWLGEGALLLCGRGGREARERCTTCRGRGRSETGAPCVDCRGRNGQSTGFRVYDVPELVEPPLVDRVQGAINWTSFGKLHCTRHPEVEIAAADAAARGQTPYCGACYGQLMAAIERARYVIVNYELLVQHHSDIGGGQVVARADLRGWVDVLKQFRWDVCIADEGQMLRGWSTSRKRRGVPRNEKLLELVGANTIPRVWIVTGTPFYGFVRDIFWLLEIASGGLWGSDTRLRGLKFMARYCEGVKTAYGYQANGRSAYAEVELMRRLTGGPRAPGTLQHDGIMIQRTREDLFADVPPMTRQVVYLELEATKAWVPGQSKRGGDRIAQMIMALNDQKREAVLDKLVNELSEGNKIVVFCFHVASARKTFIALEKAIGSAALRTRMRQVNAQIWLASGPKRKKSDADADADADAEGDDTDDVEAGGDDELTAEQRANWATGGDARYAMAARYREHVGAACLVATTDSMPGALSLRGASSVHFLDLHWSPGAMAQAENRPWHPEVKDLSVIYYVARNSIDDHLAAEVLPKAETLARMGREQGAAAMLSAFGRKEEKRTLESIFSRLTKHLGLDAALEAEDDGTS